MNIVGIDEVGHGAIAGPVAICAYMSDLEDPLLYYKDSKGLNRKQRRKYSPVYKELALEYHTVQIDSFEINRTTAVQARNLAIDIALEKFTHPIHKLLIDGSSYISKEAGKKYEKIIEYIPGGDKKVWQIAASSIIAKVHRDEFMTVIGEQYPEYEWKKNAGYSDETHLEALVKLGATPYHRVNNLAVIKSLEKGEEQDV